MDGKTTVILWLALAGLWIGCLMLANDVINLERRMDEMEKEFFRKEGVKPTAIALIYGEARLQEKSYADEILEATGILCVVRNRTKWSKYNKYKTYEEKLMEVMMEDLQFSVFNPFDKNSDMSYEFIKTRVGTKRYDLYSKLVDTVLFGEFPDVTQGADHYVAEWLYASKDGWWKRMTTKLIAGGHRFLS